MASGLLLPAVGDLVQPCKPRDGIRFTDAELRTLLVGPPVRIAIPGLSGVALVYGALAARAGLPTNRRVRMLGNINVRGDALVCSETHLQ
jgi:hypothetical protein